MDTDDMERPSGQERVTVGLCADFPVPAIVDFLLDPDTAPIWLGDGAVLGGAVGDCVVVTAIGVTGAVAEIRRTGSSFRLRAVWEDSQRVRGGQEFLLRVTTLPGGRSRIRITETRVTEANIAAYARFWDARLRLLGHALRLASAKRRRYRQAIVVVHGIGQQRQTSALRAFVKAVFPRGRGVVPMMKPDYVSPLVGAASVTVPGRWTVNRPTTDVYEFYWAHLVRDTTVGQVYSWMFRLLLAPGKNITAGLRPHVYLLRSLLAVVALAAAALAVAYFAGAGPRGFVTALLTAAAALIPAVAWKIAKWFGSPLHNLVVAGALGDAARYLDTSPGNVQMRQDIREAGLRLLNELHDRGRYSRIIVYGHSLGSVIAYDILAHAWTRRSRSHTGVPPGGTPALRAVEDLLNPRHSNPGGTSVQEVRSAQHAAWQEFTENGFGWLVSDLVTAGSPLSHARWLLNPDKSASVDDLMMERSMPCCPPRTNPVRSPKPCRQRNAFTFTHSYRNPGDPRAQSVLVPDHGALFALVRWTNVYFPHRKALRGDPVGGPVQQIFGSWVDDLPLAAPTKGFAHTHYLSTAKGAGHVDTLRAALDLSVSADIVTWLRRALSDLPEEDGVTGDAGVAQV